jgi:hypothetical protein
MLLTFHAKRVMLAAKSSLGDLRVRGQVTFLAGVLGEVEGTAHLCSNIAPGLEAGPSAAFLQSLFLCRWSRAILFRSAIFDSKGSLLYGMDHASPRRD